ncbi:MAG: HD domain-containing phosphohydrolase [Candidatus Omnitrophota bacterium]
MKNSLTPTQRYKRLLLCIHSLYRLLNSTFNLKDFISRLARLICQALSIKYCSIIIFDPNRKTANLRCVIDRQKKCSEEKIKNLNRIEKKVIDTSSIFMDKKILAVPLIAEEIIGIIIVHQQTNKNPFSSWEQEILMTIAQQALIAIKNIRLYEEQQKIIMGSIKSLVTLMDVRLPREYSHSPYFPDLVCAIGEQMDLNEKQIESLKYAGLLHDAGKIDIPTQILTKTGKLTPYEHKIIRRHPMRGAKMIGSLQVLKPAIPIILYHHEKYNGTGYPSRLKKGQIPIGARIMAVADAFEAMVYGRPYRERMDIASAIKEIKKKSQTQFDPKVVEAFLRAIKTAKIKKCLKKYRR